MKAFVIGYFSERAAHEAANPVHKPIAIIQGNSSQTKHFGSVNFAGALGASLDLCLGIF